MNFLLHYHLARRDLGTAGGAVGSMLPDLWGMADRKVRPHKDLRRPSSEAHPELAALLDGIRHHLAADRWFHNSAVFARGEALATARLRTPRFTADKMGLLGHITWELCLDGALARREGLEMLLARLRADLETTPEHAWRTVAEAHHFSRVERPASARRRFGERMAQLRAELGDGAWIRSYTHGGGLADRLAGIRRRVGLQALGEADHKQLAEVLDHLLGEAERLLPVLLWQAPVLDVAAVA